MEDIWLVDNLKGCFLQVCGVLSSAAAARSTLGEKWEGECSVFHCVEGLQRTIAWLKEWPAGLKLNNELVDFLGDLFLWVIEHWAGKWWKTVTMTCLLMPSYSLHRQPAAIPTTSNIHHWMLEFCRGQHANCSLVRFTFDYNYSHLFFLHSVRAHFQLAT